MHHRFASFDGFFSVCLPLIRSCLFTSTKHTPRKHVHYCAKVPVHVISSMAVWFYSSWFLWFCLNRRLHFLLGHANCHYAVIGLSARRKSHAPHLAGVSATILESCTKHARSDDVTVELRTVTCLSAYDWNTDLIQDAIVTCTCTTQHDVRWGMRICQHHSSAFSIL